MTTNSTESTKASVNIAGTERWVTAFVGGGLATYGLLRSPAPGNVLSGYAMTAAGLYLIFRGATGHCPAYSALGVNPAIEAEETSQKLGDVGIKVTHAVSIQKPIGELYAYWRDFTNLPHIMDHLNSVTVQDGTKSHWVAKAPLGRTVEWDAELINDEPNKVIAWKSLPDADVINAGAVTFKTATQGRGTEVRVEISYAPPAGKLGAIIAHILGEDPKKQLDDDLRHFKQMMEAGERPTTEGQASGRGPDKDQVK